MSKILRCKKCGDIIQSTHRHDMVWCKCGAVAIDGGDDYCRLTGNLDDMEFLSAEKDLNDMFIRCMQMLSSKDKELSILEKALELAVEKMKTRFECLVNDERGIVKQSEFMEYFKTKATEIIDGKEN